MSDEPRLPPPSRLTGYGFGSGAQNGPGVVLTREPAGEEPAAGRKKRSGVLRLVLVLALVAAALAGGAFLITKGTSGGVAQDAPLPAQADYQAPPDQATVGTDGIVTVPVENADTGGGEAGWRDPARATPVTEMSVDLMEPMSVFVPAAKLYSLARPSDVFSPSKYDGMASIQVPDNPRRTVWHAAGGAMAGKNADGSEAVAGTTFLGSHSGYAGQWGAYVHTAHLRGGETVWTKDADGNLQRWQVDRIRYMPHTEFPQEHWNTEGDRRLVLTTCGGTAGADGVYNQNVFVEAKPVHADGSAL